MSDRNQYVWHCRLCGVNLFSAQMRDQHHCPTPAPTRAEPNGEVQPSSRSRDGGAEGICTCNGQHEKCEVIERLEQQCRFLEADQLFQRERAEAAESSIERLKQDMHLAVSNAGKDLIAERDSLRSRLTRIEKAAEGLCAVLEFIRAHELDENEVTTYFTACDRALHAFRTAQAEKDQGGGKS